MKNSNFKISFQKFRRQLDAVINERANRIKNEVSQKIVKTFEKRAKKRLDNFASGEGSKSANIIYSLKNNIIVDIYENTGEALVRVKMDKEGLMMFLEYGTGIAGSYNEHPEARKIGWLYVTNPKHYKRPLNTIPSLKYNGYGWFFYKGNTYIGNSDYENITFKYSKSQQVSGYTIKHGKRAGTFVKPYIRNVKSKPDRVIDYAVFTQGIKPLRYMYDTRIEMQKLLDKCKTISDFNKEIRKLEKL